MMLALSLIVAIVGGIALMGVLSIGAIQRTKEIGVLVGSRCAIGMAVKNNKVAHRFAALEWPLGGQ